MFSIHSFLSLSWDEWGSILVIFTAIIGIIKWVIKKLNAEIIEPIYHKLSDVNDNLTEFNKRQAKAEIRLENGDKKFIRHDEQLKDHERRITSLEEIRNERDH